MATMIEIRQLDLRCGFVRGILKIEFPVSFGGGEVQLLFLFERFERIEVRLLRVLPDQFGKRGNSFRGRRID